MILDLVQEITVMDVLDRGVANRERVVLRVNSAVNMGQFGLMLGVQGPGDTAWPINDNLFWFGDGVVIPGDWIFVFTGPGQSQQAKVPNSAHNTMYSVYWGRSTTVFHNSQLAPILFRVGGVQVRNLNPNALTAPNP